MYAFRKCSQRTCPFRLPPFARGFKRYVACTSSSQNYNLRRRLYNYWGDVLRRQRTCPLCTRRNLLRKAVVVELLASLSCFVFARHEAIQYDQLLKVNIDFFTIILDWIASCLAKTGKQLPPISSPNS